MPDRSRPKRESARDRRASALPVPRLAPFTKKWIGIATAGQAPVTLPLLASILESYAKRLRETLASPSSTEAELADAEDAVRRLILASYRVGDDDQLRRRLVLCEALDWQGQYVRRVRLNATQAYPSNPDLRKRAIQSGVGAGVAHVRFLFGLVYPQFAPKLPEALLAAALEGWRSRSNKWEWVSQLADAMDAAARPKTLESQWSRHKSSGRRFLQLPDSAGGA